MAGLFSGATGSGQTSVVIVDDDWLAAEINAAVLRAAGMTVDIVNEPRHALEAIETLRPDLVLMDMQMPDVSGLELARIIRQTRQFMSTPIVFLAGERDEASQLEARKFGGDDFISKSIGPDRLVTLVRLRADRARLLRSMIERDGHSRHLDPLMLDAVSVPQPKDLLGDKGYDSNSNREDLLMQGIRPVIPSNRSRKVIIPHDKDAYKNRNRIERMINMLKQNRHIAMRFDKTLQSFAAFISLVVVKLWLPTFVNRT